MKIVIGTPCYDGKVSLCYLDSLLTTIQQLTDAGIDIDIKTVRGTLVDRARDEIANYALEADATHLLFIDADMGWGPGLVEALIKNCDLPIVAAVAPSRKLPIEYRVKFAAEMPPIDKERGVVKVDGAGTGIMLIKTEVLRKLGAAMPSYVGIKGKAIKRIFGNYFDGTNLYGEDLSFCMNAGSEGFDTFVVFGHEVTHHGDMEFKGRWPRIPKEMHFPNPELAGLAQAAPPEEAEVTP